MPTERTKIKAPRATINRLKELERLIDMTEDRELKVQNLRTAMRNGFTGEEQVRLVNLCNAALTSIEQVKHVLDEHWNATMPDDALSVDDLVPDDAS